MTEQPQLPKLLDIPAVAEIMGTSARHVRGLVAERRIPYVKVGHFIRFDPDEVRAWLDGCRVAERRCTGGAGRRSTGPLNRPTRLNQHLNPPGQSPKEDEGRGR
jgi:excisionase family DNA binding protein